MTASRLLLLFALGCSSSHAVAFTRAMSQADLAAEKGDLSLAAQRFELAAQSASSPRDRDEARHAAARMRARAGDIDGAIRALDVLARAAPPGPEAASALYDLALLRLDHGDEATGWRDVEAVILRFPDDGAARPALHRWLQHQDDELGAAASLAWLRRVRAQLDRTDRAEEIAYETALRLERTGDAGGARAAFLATAARWPYPGGALWDDALFHASALAERAGQPAEAIHDLKRMLSQREKATLVGSAERARYAEAELHLGELYRDKLLDRKSAREAFHSLYADFDESPLRARGLFEEAEILRADGDGATACDRYETLVRSFPDSRYAACAAASCPSMRAKPGVRAATPCRAYVRAAAPLEAASDSSAHR
jgi:TolA-binding protein